MHLTIARLVIKNYFSLLLSILKNILTPPPGDLPRLCEAAEFRQ